ncbi:hypothetical protein F5146DRAFT_1133634 [Armillaria mellea]|nr:hypothetical protein F5146DRAFT_1133634 [Armillaria mellea]
MSSLSSYDSVVPTQQHDSMTPIKDVVDDTFEEWLHSLKSLVADAPAQKLQLEFQSLRSRLNKSEALNQQLHRELKHKQAVGLHEHRVLRTRLSQHHVHLRAQESYIAAISNATIRDLPPMTQNIENLLVLTNAVKCPKCSTDMWSAVMVTECNCTMCVACVYEAFSDQTLAHFLEENSSTVTDSLTDVSIPHERHDGTATVEKYTLHCPLCQGAVCWKPQSIPIMELVCKALNTTEASATGSMDLLLSHELDPFFH